WVSVGIRVPACGGVSHCPVSPCPPPLSSVSKAYSDLALYQKKHDVNPLRGFLVPLVQAPIFISFFVALRKMSYLPVPSMQSGGIWWFSDLTAADPFYILPVIVTFSMWAVLE
ncbi:hypothetical protein FKM82_030912, partial [Ascaphus truei]